MKTVGAQRGLGNAQNQRLGRGRFAALGADELIGILEFDAIHLFLDNKIRIPGIEHLDPAHHLSDDTSMCLSLIRTPWSR